MTTDAEKSALHWEALAQAQREQATYAASRGEYTGVFETRAKTYDNAAKAIRLTEETGVDHCSCHLIPVKDARRLYDKVGL